MSNEVLNESMMMDVLNIWYEKAVNELAKAKEILNKSGIDKEFRDKRLDNFDFLEIDLLKWLKVELSIFIYIFL